jgi:hypothetical protein
VLSFGIIFKLILLVGGLLFLYFLFNPFFYLALLLLILWFLYKFLMPLYRKSVTPQGKRINHKMLRGYMTEKYGKDEGVKIYKDFVRNLRNKGYY